MQGCHLGLAIEVIVEVKSLVVGLFGDILLDLFGVDLLNHAKLTVYQVLQLFCICNP